MTSQVIVKYRLFFGTVMAAIFTAVVILDAWLDGSITISEVDDRTVQATILSLLVVALLIAGQRELARLGAARNLKFFSPLTEVASVLLATGWYWRQLVRISPCLSICFLSAFTLLAFLVYQYLRYGSSAVMANCGANYFSVVYLGLLSAFVLGIRIDFGPWRLLMFILAVKSADIGAYAGGTLLGRHKFSPRISPGKTWEGMAAAVVTSVAVSVAFAVSCDIMAPYLAGIFGFTFAIVGQFGDLAESMIKRDAEQKDSADKVPGFGGVLDIIDSPLVAAPFGYLFFELTAGISAS